MCLLEANPQRLKQITQKVRMELNGIMTTEGPSAEETQQLYHVSNQQIQQLHEASENVKVLRKSKVVPAPAPR